MFGTVVIIGGQTDRHTNNTSSNKEIKIKVISFVL